jgi:hypothetical protein
MGNVKLYGASSGYVEIVPTAASGTSTLTLPAATGTLATTANVAAIVPGKILQVVSTTKTDTFSTASTTMADVTGLSVSITPAATSSKIFVSVKMNYGSASGSQIALFRLLRDTTPIAIGDAAGSRQQVFADTRQNDTASTIALGVDHLDSPATTSATTYKVQMAVQGGTNYVNRTAADLDNSLYGRLVSTITVMEIGA